MQKNNHISILFSVYFILQLASPHCKFPICRSLISSPAAGLDFSASPASVQSVSGISFPRLTASHRSIRAACRSMPSPPVPGRCPGWRLPLWPIKIFQHLELRATGRAEPDFGSSGAWLQTSRSRVYHSSCPSFFRHAPDFVLPGILPRLKGLDHFPQPVQR